MGCNCCNNGERVIRIDPDSSGFAGKKISPTGRSTPRNDGVHKGAEISIVSGKIGLQDPDRALDFCGIEKNRRRNADMAPGLKIVVSKEMEIKKNGSKNNRESYDNNFLVRHQCAGACSAA